GDLVPPTQADNFHLRAREHSKCDHSGVQNDGWDRSLIVEPWRETNRDAQHETQAIFPGAMRFEELFQWHHPLQGMGPACSPRIATADTGTSPHTTKLERLSRQTPKLPRGAYSFPTPGLT